MILKVFAMNRHTGLFIYLIFAQQYYRMETDSTFWQSQAEEFNLRAKKSLRRYQLQRFNQLYKSRHNHTSNLVDPQPQILSKSLRQIQKLSKEEDQKVSFFQSRMKFLQVSRDRKHSQGQLLKKKHQHMIHARQQKQLQSSLNQSMVKLLQQQHKHSKQIVMQRRSQKSRVQQMIRQNINNKRVNARSVRERNAACDEACRLQRSQSISINQQKASRIKFEQKASRQRLERMRECTMSARKANRNKSLMSESRRCIEKLNKSTEMRGKLKSEQDKIIEDIQQSDKKIETLAMKLGIRSHPRSYFTHRQRQLDAFIT